MLKLKALVIDDSRVMRNMVMQALRRAMLAEFEFLEADGGAEALARFDPTVIDIAFIDWNMPQMSGIDCVRAIRARGDSNHVPLVLVTSEASASRIEDTLAQAGADAFICKPFTVDELERKLRKIMDQLAEARQPTPGSRLLSKLFS